MTLYWILTFCHDGNFIIWIVHHISMKVKMRKCCQQPNGHILHPNVDARRNTNIKETMAAEMECLNAELAFADHKSAAAGAKSFSM